MLSPAVYHAVGIGTNHLSVVTYWEVVIKSMKGKLDVGDPQAWWTLSLKKLNATFLNLKPEHIDGVYNLPMIHKDPFDRVLIAQAIAENLTLVTTDAAIARYASDDFSVIV